MAIGRITGSVLKSNLTRNGVDLAFETNLLYLDVTNSRVGIGTSEPATALHVVGNTTISDSLTANSIVTNNISSADSSAVQVNDALNVSGTVTTNTLHTQTLTVTDINSDDSTTIQVDGSWQVSGFYYGDGRYLTGLAPALQQYQFASTASDISTYYVAKDLADYTQGTLGTATVTVGTSGTLLASFATQTGYPNITVIPSGKVQILFETQKASGPKAYTCYAEVYKRNTSGTETLLFTTDVSSSIAANTLVQQDVSYFVGAPITLSLTDRLVIKIYAYTSSGTDGITLTWDSNTSAGLLLPTVPASATNFVPYLNATADVNLGSYGLKASAVTTNAISSDDSTAIQINDSVNISGTLTAPTFVTNAISSSDSSAVQINDAVNISGTLTAKTFVTNELNSEDSTAIQVNDALNVSGTLTANTFITNNISSSESSAIQIDDGLNVSGTLTANIIQTNELSSTESTAIQVNDSLNASGTITAAGFVTHGTSGNITGVNNIELNQISSNDSTAVQVADGMNVSGTLTAPTFVTNDISSGDSTAIQINDGLNVSGTLSTDVLDVNEISSLDSSAIQINDAVNVNGTLNAKTIITNNISSEDSTAIQIDDAVNVSGALTANSGFIANGIAYPTTDGLNGQVLQTDGEGNISFADGGGGGGGNNTAISQLQFNVLTNSSTVVDEFDIEEYRAAVYHVSLHDITNSLVGQITLNVVHNDSSAFISLYELNEDSTNLATFTVAISGTKLQLSAVANAQSSHVNLNLYRIGLSDQHTTVSNTNSKIIKSEDMLGSAVVAIDTFTKADIQAAKYYILVKDDTNSQYQVSEVSLVHNGTSAFVNTYGVNTTSGSTLATFNASISGSSLSLTALSSGTTTATTLMYRIDLGSKTKVGLYDGVTYGLSSNFDSSTKVVDQFDVFESRTARYFVHVQNTTNGTYQNSEISLISNGSDSYITESIIRSGSSDIGTFIADYNSGKARLIFSGNSADNIIYYARLTYNIPRLYRKTHDTTDKLYISANTVQIQNNLNVENNINVNGTLTPAILNVTGSSTLDGITIIDNTISTNASNANLELKTSGTGSIVLKATREQYTDPDYVIREYILYGTTTDSLETEIFVGGVSNSRIPVATNSTMNYTVDFTARRTDVDGTSAGYQLKGVIDNNSGTVADVGNVYEIMVSEDDATLAVDARADNTNKSLDIFVQGTSGATFRWLACVKTYEVIE
jgi:hypothetical protein